MLTTATSADDSGDLEAIPPVEPALATDPVPARDPGTPRPKRDYNYFADLRKALAELQDAKERSLPAGDDDA